MTWFKKQRQDFIRANLSVYGMVRRKQIMDRFEVTSAIASADIQAFMSANPDLIDYDRNAKCYTFDAEALAQCATAITSSPAATLPDCIVNGDVEAWLFSHPDRDGDMEAGRLELFNFRMGYAAPPSLTGSEGGGRAVRLLDLEPRYLSNGDGRPDWTDRHWHEIAFLCPKCRKHEIAVAFWSNEPRDHVQVGENESGPVIKRLWQRQGQQGFQDLTLTPSINREGCGDKCGGWHGFITNGEAA